MFFPIITNPSLQIKHYFPISYLQYHIFDYLPSDTNNFLKDCLMLILALFYICLFYTCLFILTHFLHNTDVNTIFFVQFAIFPNVTF